MQSQRSLKRNVEEGPKEMPVWKKDSQQGSNSRMPGLIPEFRPKHQDIFEIEEKCVCSRSLLKNPNQTTTQ